MTVPVTIVIPTYARADYVLVTLESVLAHEPPPREVIVVDDGSPDDTPALLAPLARDGRIRYVRQPNAGLAAARNAGAALATSEYLYFIDDDDLLFPNALSWLVEELEQHPDAAMAYGASVLFSGDPPPPPSLWSETRAVDRNRFLLFNQIGSPGQALIRRSAFYAVGGFDSRFLGTEDWDLWLKLLKLYSAHSAQRPVLAYRLHDGNMSRNVAQMYESSLKVAREHLRHVPIRQHLVMRCITYRRLRCYHVPRLEQMLGMAVGQGDWRRATAAARAWVIAWTTDLGASISLKAQLVGHGRWRLPVDEPLLRL